MEQSGTQILVCPTHGPMSNRDAMHHIDRFGIATSVCPDCGRILEFVGIEEMEKSCAQSITTNSYNPRD